MRLSFHPEVSRDVGEILDHYGAISSELARRFDDQLEQLYGRIAANPKRFSPIDLSSGLRRARLPDFPYLIIYRELDDRVRVLSVRHEKRDPAHASERR